MNIDVLEQHAAKVAEHQVRGERCTACLRALIERMRMGRHDVEEAERLPAIFKQIQALHAAGELELMQQLLSLTS